MDPTSSLPGSPGGNPLQPASNARVNHQRDPSSLHSSLRHDDSSRDSAVHDKINQFNNLAMQSKQLERKTADAALKRAMLGREEAESDMRRYREETRALRKQVEEGLQRERKVGERLETVMVGFLFGGDYGLRNLPYLTLPTGKLRSRKRDARPHSSPMGEGNPASTKGDLQDPERHSEAARGAEIGASGSKVCGGDARRGKGAQ